MSMLSAHALTTIKALKAELGIPADDSSQDDQLARYINAASDAMRTYCNRDFARAQRTDVIKGPGERALLLRLFPLIEVHRVIVEEQEVDDFVVDKETGILWRSVGWPKTNVPAITVEYTGGYVTPYQARQDEQLERNLPYDIEEACIVTAATWLSQQGTPRDATILQVEQIRVHFGGRESGAASMLPVAVQRLLGSYRRWA